VSHEIGDNGQTDRQPENIMPSTYYCCWMHKKSLSRKIWKAVSGREVRLGV